MDNQIGYVSEICLNLLNSNIIIEKDLKKRLNRVKLILKKIASIKLSKNIKRGILKSLKGQFILKEVLPVALNRLEKIILQ